MKTVISPTNAPDQLLTSHEVGALLQVNPSSVNNWVNEGRIPAFRTPGGHRRIRIADLVQFLSAHDMPIPRHLDTRRRLLVVDDDKRYLASLKRLARGHAAQVDIELVENGIDALVRVGAFEPHLIVLDVFMPDVDGVEVCRRLKANEGTRGIDVLVTSGNLTPEIERKARAAGAMDCLHKPVRFTTILQHLLPEQQLPAQRV